SDPLRPGEEARDDRGHALPALGLQRELFAPGPRELVEAGAPVVLGGAPLGADPPLLLEPEERGGWRDLVHLQKVLGDLLDPARDAVAVHRTERVERLEDYEVE